MRSLRKYFWVGFTSARSNLAYFGEVVARIIFLGVLLYIFLQLWRLTYSETGAQRLGGLTLAQMLWYLAMTESIILSSPRVSVEVDQDVRTGSLAVQLIRPLSYPLYRLWTTLGERLVRFGLNVLVGSAIALLLVGPIPFSVSGLAMFFLSLPLAFVLDFLGLFLVGLAAFWLEDTSGLAFLYSRLSMILGGTLIPLELFPESFQPILTMLPFSSMVYGPARMFVHPDPWFFINLMAKQALAILIFSLGVTAVYSIAVKRISAQGG